jgi:hypothetical protein
MLWRRIRTGKKRMAIMFATVSPALLLLLIASLLILSALHVSPVKAVAKEVGPYAAYGKNNDDYSNSNNANGTSPRGDSGNGSDIHIKDHAKQRQQYWQDFLRLERESSHYNYTKTEKQNVMAYQKWYCADLRLHKYEDFTHACDASAYPKDQMWEHERYRDEILWNKANHQPHYAIKKTSEQERYLHYRADVREDMANHQKAGDITWEMFKNCERIAWHYNYTKTEKQNINAFKKWYGSDLTNKMWYYEQYRDEILWNKTIDKSQRGCDSAKSHMKSWFEDGYAWHMDDIAKNKCVNPWDRTPENAAPSWTACLDANSSAHTAVAMATHLPILKERKSWHASL